MTVETLASVLAPFVAVLGAAAWLHAQLSSLREVIAELKARISHLERELEHLRNHRRNS